MNDWSEGYFTDAVYTHGYYRELSPHFMNWCLLLKGFVAPEISDDARHCELGIGQGLSANIHAATTLGKFFGTDFNPAHAAQAQELADASDADAKFFEDSFEEFAARDDLPKFDTISLHGIWSWISEENRQHIVDIARKHLKSGGVLYCSYNCLPGWAPAAPMRELLKLHDVHTTGRGTIENRVQSALTFVEEMIAAKPGYLNIAPMFAKRFEELKKHNAHYIAHEYLNLDWDLMYFTDVVEKFRDGKLDFAMSAIPIETFATLGFSDEAQTFIEKIDDSLLREQVRDYFINRQFRKDLFVRGLRRLPLVKAYEKLLEMRYVLMRPAKDVPLKFVTAAAEVNLSEEIYKPLLEFLQEDNFRPKTLTEYARRYPEKTAKEFIEAATFLVNENHIMPCQSDNVVKRVKKYCERLNAHICEQAKFDEAIGFVASPLIGGGINLNRFQQIFLAMYKGGEKSAERFADGAWEIMARQGQKLMRDGKPVEDKDENLKVLREMAEKFLTEELPIYKVLQL